MTTTVTGTVGLIGAGLMGKGIGKVLMEKGFALSVVAHRNRAPVEELLALGATESNSVAELASSCDFIITCLPSIPAVIEVFEGAEGVLAHARQGCGIIDTTTSDPELTKRLHRLAAEKDIRLVDAPLLGRPQQTWDGTIGIAVGGEEEDLALCQSVLEAFAKKIFKVGGPGSGHTVKLINNAVTLTNSAILYEAFTVARKQGVDLETLYGVLDISMASSKRLHAIAPALIQDDHKKTFGISVATKDVVLYSGLTTSIGVPSLVGDSTRQLYQLACAMGYGEENVTRIATALAELSGVSFGSEQTR